MLKDAGDSTKKNVAEKIDRLEGRLERVLKEVE